MPRLLKRVGLVDLDGCFVLKNWGKLNDTGSNGTGNGETKQKTAPKLKRHNL
ncbi:MAG: hypothetical protein ACXWIU_08955 [Limisphaerales bacterium]